MRTIVNAAVRQHLVAVDGGHVRLLTRLPQAEPASCAPLRALVSQLDLEHPHFPVPYGTMDPRFTGGQGVDWKPVPRTSPSTVDDLPMTALLSQVLVAFAIDYESERRGPIQWAANALRGLDGRRLDDPATPGHAPHNVPQLQRKGVVTIDPSGVVRLTARGRAIRDSYRGVCERVDARWRARFGSPLLDEIAAAVHVDGGWPAFPLIAWTGDEFAALPSE